MTEDTSREGEASFNLFVRQNQISAREIRDKASLYCEFGYTYSRGMITGAGYFGRLDMTPGQVAEDISDRVDNLENSSRESIKRLKLTTPRRGTVYSIREIAASLVAHRQEMGEPLEVVLA